MHFFSERANTFRWNVRAACSTLFATLLAVLILVPCALAQGITGSITGTVTDAAGAVVYDATRILYSYLTVNSLECTRL